MHWFDQVLYVGTVITDQQSISFLYESNAFATVEHIYYGRHDSFTWYRIALRKGTVGTVLSKSSYWYGSLALYVH